jgi:hypothetical protein
MEKIRKTMREINICALGSWGPYLFTSYQFAKFKDQINIGPGYFVINVNGMCYYSGTCFEIFFFFLSFF